MRINITLSMDKPKWWYKIFTCRHEVGTFEEHHGRYESFSSYLLCKKCGRSAGDLERSCKHEEDCFGVCRYCRQRQSKHDCSHIEWYREPDTDEYYCESCGEWKKT